MCSQCVLNVDEKLFNQKQQGWSNLAFEALFVPSGETHKDREQ